MYYHFKKIAYFPLNLQKILMTICFVYSPLIVPPPLYCAKICTQNLETWTKYLGKRGQANNNPVQWMLQTNLQILDRLSITINCCVYSALIPCEFSARTKYITLREMCVEQTINSNIDKIKHLKGPDV